jgi:hypothetical protein
MAAGDFSASQVPLLKQTVQEAWEKSRANNARSLFDPSTVALQAIMANDVTADFKQYVTLPDNCLGVNINWMEFNPTATMDTSFTNHQVVPCAIDGPLAESKSQTYKIEKRAKSGFSVPETQCQNLFGYAEKYAYQMLQVDRALIKTITAHALNRLHGFSGGNVVPVAEKNNIGTYASGVTKVAPENMKWQDFYPYLQMVKDYNRMENPFLLDGTVFMHQRFLAAVQAGTLSDNGASAAFDLENYYSDPRSFTDAGISQKIYYISQGAIAMATAARNPVQAQTYQTQSGPAIRYQEPISGLTTPTGQPIMKDVFIQQLAVPTGNGTDCELVRKVSVEVPFELFLNPKLSTDTVTGVMEFAIDDTLTPVVVS